MEFGLTWGFGGRCLSGGIFMTQQSNAVENIFDATTTVATTTVAIAWRQEQQQSQNPNQQSTAILLTYLVYNRNRMGNDVDADNKQQLHN